MSHAAINQHPNSSAPPQRWPSAWLPQKQPHKSVIYVIQPPNKPSCGRRGPARDERPPSITLMAVLWKLNLSAPLKVNGPKSVTSLSSPPPSRLALIFPVPLCPCHPSSPPPHGAHLHPYPSVLPWAVLGSGHSPKGPRSCAAWGQGNPCTQGKLLSCQQPLRVTVPPCRIYPTSTRCPVPHSSFPSSPSLPIPLSQPCLSMRIPVPSVPKPMVLRDQP